MITDNKSGRPVLFAVDVVNQRGNRNTMGENFTLKHGPTVDLVPSVIRAE